MDLALNNLLYELFGEDGFSAKKFLRDGPHGEEMLLDLPSPLLGVGNFIDEWLAQARRRGLIDAPFFRRMVQRFPHRYDAIFVVAQGYGFDIGDAPRLIRSRWIVILLATVMVIAMAMAGAAFLASDELPEEMMMARYSDPTSIFPTTRVSPDRVIPPPSPLPPSTPAIAPIKRGPLITALRKAGRTDSKLAECWKRLRSSKWREDDFAFEFDRGDAAGGIVVTVRDSTVQGTVSSCFEGAFAGALGRRGIRRIATTVIVELRELRPPA